MLLVIDVGNTNVAIGVIDDDGAIVTDWRLATDHYRTADEWGQMLCTLLQMQDIKPSSIEHISIACVVPPLETSLDRMCARYFKITPFFATNSSVKGLTILYDKPAEVGADRVVNSIAAINKYGGPCIIIDFGTATTFDAVNSRDQYVGGVICPGIVISSDALFDMAAKLPRVDLVRPKRVIGMNTVESMQSGLYFGYLEQVKGIVVRMRKELEGDAKVIVTGGLARVFAQDLGGKVICDDTLTLEGLRIVYNQHNS